MPQPVFYDSEVSIETPIDLEKVPELGGGGSPKVDVIPAAKVDNPPAKTPVTFDSNILYNEEIVEEIPVQLPTVDVVDTVDDNEEPATIVKKEEPKNTKVVGDDTPRHENSPSSSSASVFAKSLFDEGVITEFDETEFNELVEKNGVGAALVELNRRTIEDGIEMYKNSLNPIQKKLLDALEKGVPAEDFLSNQSKQVKLAEIKEADILKNDSLSKALIVEDLRARNYSDDEILEQIKTFEDLGQLGAKALKSHKFLVKREAENETAMVATAEQRQKDDALAAKKSLDTLKATIDASKEIMPGIALTTKEKNDLYSLIVEPVHQVEQTGEYVNAIWAERLKNPMQFDITMAYLYKQGVFSGKWDSVVKKTKSKAIEELNTFFENGGGQQSAGLPARNGFKTTPKATEILKGMEGLKTN